MVGSAATVPPRRCRMSFPLIGRRVTVLGAFTLVGIVAACASGASPSPSPAAASPAGTTVAITLQEWSVNPEQPSAPAGEVTFNVTNAGPAEPHELVVVKTDLDHRQLPTTTEGRVDEAGAGIEVIGEIEEFQPGETKSAPFQLVAGKYVLVCNVAEDVHYQKGMSVPFEVK